MGDGIEHLQCDERGNIWVGYFDEGVFGADIFSREGLARFDREGRFAWGYHSQGGEPPIDDCYVMNVSGRDAWTCFYSEFPIVRVTGGGEWKAWPLGLTGERALAVDGFDVILFGGYEPHRGRIAHVRLGEKYCEWLGVLDLAGDEPDQSFTAFGRGDRIHLVGPSGWRSFSVADVLAAMARAGSAAIPDYDSLDEP